MIKKINLIFLPFYFLKSYLSCFKTYPYLVMNPFYTTTIIIADDHAIYRNGLKTFLENQPDVNYRIVAEAANGVELLKKVERYNPDIVITDIGMPEMDGIESCKSIKENHPLTTVIALTFHEEREFVLQMIYAGASAYVIKNNPPEDILRAIETVLKGIAYYSSTICDKIVNNNKNKQINFSATEIKIIKLICTQSTNKEIAEATQLHVRTIEDYREKIRGKMQVKNAV